VASQRIFKVQQPHRHGLAWGDLAVLIVFAAVVYVGVRLTLDAPRHFHAGL
jgi:hypothetical protein